MVKQVKLTKLTNNENKLRTKNVIGEPAFYPPELEKSFVVFSKPLNEEMNVRIVRTSEVVGITRNEIGYVIETLNSRYLIEEVQVKDESNT